MDWRDTRTSACNGNRNPIQQDFYDGINADPLEVLFIKVKASMRQAGWGHVTKARILQTLGMTPLAAIRASSAESPVLERTFHARCCPQPATLSRPTCRQ